MHLNISVHNGLDTIISNWDTVPILLSYCCHQMLDKYLQHINTLFIYIKQKEMLKDYELHQMELIYLQSLLRDLLMLEV